MSYEGENCIHCAPVLPGTINTIVIINKPLTPAAQAKAVVMIAEAKAAALAELAVPSEYRRTSPAWARINSFSRRL
jgi:adenosylcobinamide amidohydrolase